MTLTVKVNDHNFYTSWNYSRMHILWRVIVRTSYVYGRTEERTDWRRDGETRETTIPLQPEKPGKTAVRTKLVPIRLLTDGLWRSKWDAGYSSGWRGVSLRFWGPRFATGIHLMKQSPHSWYSPCCQRTESCYYVSIQNNSFTAWFMQHADPNHIYHMIHRIFPCFCVLGSFSHSDYELNI